ncbi:MAG: hypothetical protein EOO92_01075 [Pedobacter sp.]|nr:MAG: hypothetical protein EOO92_01075 [Pedobacter sp.]
MKTLSKTLIAALLTFAVSASSVMTSFATVKLSNEEKSISTIPDFNKIWVSGNVKIVLTQGDKESIAGGENFDAKNTSIQSKGQTVYINSTEMTQVTLNITVKDLQRIEAYGQSVVVTTNNFDVKYLQLFLNQSATAKISAVVESLYTVINDKAALKINGSAKQHSLVAASMKNVKFNNFYCSNTKQYATQAIMDADKVAMNAK